MASSITAAVRMYQVGELGDCFLLSFKQGNKQSNVLIDCGSFRNGQPSKDRLELIVKHIRTTLEGRSLNAVVGTHQHNDHVSGFAHCEELFKDIVDEAWLSWLDNPKDGFAQQIQTGQKNLVDQLHDINTELTALKATSQPGVKPSEVVNDILGFYGLGENAPEDDPTLNLRKNSLAAKAAPRIPATGIDVLKRVGKKPPRYLAPGQIFDLPGLPANTVKVYVLGPPRDQSLLFDKDPSANETFDPHLAMAQTFAGKLLSATKDMNKESDGKWEEEYFPFNRAFKKKPEEVNKRILNLYNDPDKAWQKIDQEWSDQADRLALYLDSYTNNSSLVLAFELVQSGKFLLFPGDAQTGNWNSWKDVAWENPRPGFSTKQLLENTVLYKVGHHASHNATLKDAFNDMIHEDLVAMIPVDKSDGNITKPNGWKMPAKNLYEELKRRTKHRVLRMDDGYADECEPVTDEEKKKWKNLPTFDEANNYMEYIIRG